MKRTIILNLNPCRRCGNDPTHVRGERSTGPGISRDSVHCRPCGVEVIGDWGGEVAMKWNAINPRQDAPIVALAGQFS